MRGRGGRQILFDELSIDESISYELLAICNSKQKGNGEGDLH